METYEQEDIVTDAEKLVDKCELMFWKFKIDMGLDTFNGVTKNYTMIPGIIVKNSEAHASELLPLVLQTETADLITNMFTSLKSVSGVASDLINEMEDQEEIKGELNDAETVLEGVQEDLKNAEDRIESLEDEKDDYEILEKDIEQEREEHKKEIDKLDKEIWGRVEDNCKSVKDLALVQCKYDYLLMEMAKKDPRITKELVEKYLDGKNKNEEKGNKTLG